MMHLYECENRRLIIIANLSESVFDRGPDNFLTTRSKQSCFRQIVGRLLRENPFGTTTGSASGSLWQILKSFGAHRLPASARIDHRERSALYPHQFPKIHLHSRHHVSWGRRLAQGRILMYRVQVIMTLGRKRRMRSRPSIRSDHR